MNKFKVINWIQFMYKIYELDTARDEIFMFLKRCEMMNLLPDLEVKELLEYSEGKYKLGKELDEYEEYLKKQEEKA